MKIFLSLALVFGVWMHVVGQNRTDIWMLGTHSFDILEPKAAIDFGSGLADTFSLTRQMGFFQANASICDTLGKLLFYTNGIWIANKNHDTLLNSKDFNPGFWTDFYSPGGMGISQGAVVIPRPDHSQEYYVFAVSGEFAQFYDKIYAPLHLSLSKVDMTLDGGLGGIPEEWKDLHLIDDTLVWGRLTACKHANGRDWGVITHKFHSDLYYKFLITPDTILGPYKQSIGSIITMDVVGRGAFSPDGRKFAYVSPNDTLDIFDFDRCSGEFSNPIKIVTPDTFFISAVFSPSSRLLYVGSIVQVIQYDMYSSNIVGSATQIAAWDSTLDSGWIPTYFSQSQNAPDGRIYFSTYHGLDSLSYILHPDSLGIACTFLQDEFILPYYNMSLPNFPNYDLGPTTGDDTCNSVNTSLELNPISNSTYHIIPNPSSDWINIIYQTSEDLIFELFDLRGQRVYSLSLFHYFKNRVINVSDFPPGMYLGTIAQNGKQLWSDKIVIQH